MSTAITTPTTVGALSADDLCATRLILQHEGSTISGVLTNLDIDAEIINDDRASGETFIVLGRIQLMVTIGSITVGPIDRDHPCEVIA